jgi:dihydrofolate reductase
VIRLQLVLTEFVSLDGVIEAPGGEKGFKHTGWTIPFWNDEIGKFKLDELLATDAFLLGRVTYEGFAAVHPRQMRWDLPNV